MSEIFTSATSSAYFFTLLVGITVYFFCEFYRAGENTDENEAVEFLRQYNEGLSKMANAYSLADWAYNTNVTQENGEKAVSLKT